MKDKIKNFVDGLNKLPLLEKTPIVAFQFVSLDNKKRDGKMSWWDYLHKEADYQYIYAFREFTKHKNANDQIVNTLINWEYEDAPFWYCKLGDDPVLDVLKDEFNEVLDSSVDMNIERVPANEEEKKHLLGNWKKYLCNAFGNKGATIWVSIPHRGESGNIIYSSIFCVFNSPIPQNALHGAFRAFRDFIIDYIINFYRKADYKLIQSLEDNIDPRSFMPVYGVQKNSRASLLINQLSDEFFTSRYMKDFAKIRHQAEEDIKNLQPLITDHGSRKIENIIKKVSLSDMDDIAKMNHKDKAARFFNHIYARFMVLALCLLFDKTARVAFRMVSNTQVADKQEFKILNNFLKIKNLQDSKSNETNVIQNNGLNLDKIIPYISKKEKEFLIDCCEFISDAELATKIKTCL